MKFALLVKSFLTCTILFLLTGCEQFPTLIAPTSPVPTIPPSTANIASSTPAPVLNEAPTLLPTITPTLVPSFTPTTQPSLTPTISLLLPFSDNFDNGINPNWKVVTGTWRTVNGKLIADTSNNPSELIVGDPSWKNYIIEVDVFSNSAAGYPVGVIVRSMNGRALMFKTDCCSTDWILINGASEQSIAHLDKGGLNFTLSGFEKNHIRVEAIDQVFTGYIDGKQFLQVTDSTNSTGAVGLMSQTPFENRLLFDNFTITSP